jgi:hypothetical protein
MALPKDVSGQLVLGTLIGEGKALLDRASDAGWPELNAFRERFHLYIRVFDKLLPEEASKIKTFTFIRFLDYDDDRDVDSYGLSKHADSGWQNETNGRYAVRDFDFGQLQIAVKWLLVLAEKLRLLPPESATSEPELSQEIPVANDITERDTASAHLVPDTYTNRAEAGPAVNGPNTIGADRRAAVDAYIEEVFKATGKHMTRTDLWTGAGDNSRAEFERWESRWYEKHGKKPNKAANQRFSRILIEKPHLK